MGRSSGKLTISPNEGEIEAVRDGQGVFIPAQRDGVGSGEYVQFIPILQRRTGKVVRVAVRLQRSQGRV